MLWCSFSPVYDLWPRPCRPVVPCWITLFELVNLTYVAAKDVDWFPISSTTTTTTTNNQTTTTDENSEIVVSFFFQCSLFNFSECAYNSFIMKVSLFLFLSFSRCVSSMSMLKCTRLALRFSHRSLQILISSAFSSSSCNQIILHRILRIVKYTCHMQLHCRIDESTHWRVSVAIYRYHRLLRC